MIIIPDSIPEESQQWTPSANETQDDFKFETVCDHFNFKFIMS
jgi:hypothetical protein